MRRARDDRGATLVEYALLVALLVVVCIGAIGRLQTKGAAKLDSGAVSRGRPTEQLFLPSPSGSLVGGGSGSTVGSGAATVEVYSVSGSSAPGTNGSLWNATVVVTVKNVATPDLWSGVTVSGTWYYLDKTTSKTPAGTCVTDSSGLCPITIAGLKKTDTVVIEFRNIVLSGTGIVHQSPSPDPTSTSGPIAKP